MRPPAHASALSRAQTRSLERRTSFRFLSARAARRARASLIGHGERREPPRQASEPPTKGQEEKGYQRSRKRKGVGRTPCSLPDARQTGPRSGKPKKAAGVQAPAPALAQRVATQKEGEVPSGGIPPGGDGCRTALPSDAGETPRSQAHSGANESRKTRPRRDARDDDPSLPAARRSARRAAPRRNATRARGESEGGATRARGEVEEGTRSQLQAHRFVAMHRASRSLCVVYRHPYTSQTSARDAVQAVLLRPAPSLGPLKDGSAGSAFRRVAEERRCALRCARTRFEKIAAGLFASVPQCVPFVRAQDLTTSP